ncbi:MAG: nucleotidyl transferase AbiEii/AbiGii toxin family protein [Salinisphaera sp.]|jgi:hypothetical protein|nr:nucleotidyl transferase AbiEii/AbiGii toxin family protein [Salinisphaera sp.]
MAVVAPNLQILPPNQRYLWPDLEFTRAHGMVLYGGTAIALRAGHRESIDFDFFTDRPLDKAAILNGPLFMQDAVVLQDAIDTLTVRIPFGNDPSAAVKLSFFGNLGFGHVDEPDQTDDDVLLIASLTDLMATKLKVLFDRVEAKDYQDIAALLELGVDLPRGLAAGRALYGNAFQPAEALKAATYFKGGDLDTLTGGRPNSRVISRHLN